MLLDLLDPGKENFPPTVMNFVFFKGVGVTISSFPEKFPSICLLVVYMDVGQVEKFS